MSKHRRDTPRRFAAPVVIALALLSIVPVAHAAKPAAEPGIHASVSTGISSIYLWRGRDFTFAGAPVAVSQGSLLAQTTAPLAFSGRLRTLNAVARRGAPWEAATADTAQLDASAATRLFGGGTGVPLRERSFFGTDGTVGVEVGATLSFHYGSLIATGTAAHGMLTVEPWAELSLPDLWGAPQWSVVVDLTPDQVGFRHGFSWYPDFSVAGEDVTGYLGFFYPRNYLKQDSGSVLGELVSGEPLSALVALIPADVSLGAASLLEIMPQLWIEPEIELAFVLNRAQNPQQIVLAGAATLHYGSGASIPRVRAER